MKSLLIFKSMIFICFLFLACLSNAFCDVNVQCPGDTDGDAIIDTPDPNHPNAVCIHLTAGDGFAKMADGADIYIFGFKDVTGVPKNMVMDEGMLKAEFPAPTIKVREGQEVYLTLTNVGMVMRPDLFDPHSVHWHGYPNASSIFDGEPMASISINMGSSLTYYYVAPEPGTYMYHCHVEATEHMQMGMLGNLYVTPLQDGTVINGCTSAKYAYNDGDGSTCYDVDYPIQIHAFDSNFHEKHINVQPLPFSDMKDDYAMLNGRGYPDTVNTSYIYNINGYSSQKVHTKIEATKGQKILLRVSSLSTVDYFTLRVLGIPMKVVGRDAKLLRGPNGNNLYYETSSITLGGGQSADIILDTSDVEPGTYLLYTTNMNFLNNKNQPLGGMMTEIIIH
jgi:FtsP/CotA-like multicopper oxidase with cupredoxin domain